MTLGRYNRFLVAVVLVGLLAAVTVDWQRHQVERANNQVEMAMDYDEVTELARLEGVDQTALLRQLKDAGITSLAVSETTLDKLAKNGRVSVWPGAVLLQQYRVGTLPEASPLGRLAASGRINATDVYITSEQAAVLQELTQDLQARLGPDRVTPVAAAPFTVLDIKADYDKVLKWNLGLSAADLRYVAAQGFYVIARPSNYNRVTPGEVNGVFDRLAAVDKQSLSGMMFTGSEALGHPDLLPLTARRLEEDGLTLDMVEHPLQLGFVKQEGLLPLAPLVNYQAARVYTIGKDEQAKLKIAEAVQQYVVSDRERNIRVNFIHRFDSPAPGQTLVQTNLTYITSLKQELLRWGFTLGRASWFAPYFPAPWLLVLMLFGAAAAGVLLLAQVVRLPARWQYALWVVTAVPLAAAVLHGGGTLARQAAAAVGATAFPVLAMTWQLDRWRRRNPGPPTLWRVLRDGAAALVLTSLLSLIGGLYTAGLLGDVRFFLEILYYRGVKLTFVAPVLFITLIYLERFRPFVTDRRVPAGVWAQVKAILDYPVAVKMLLGGAVAVMAAWVFVGRSGHTAGVPVPGIELKVRHFLEEVLYARPREKEFLIGHPAFLLAVLALYRRWPRLLHYLLVVFATIGQGSLVETFSHLRSPVLLSLVRGGDGLALGLALGVIAVIAADVLCRLTYWWGRRTAPHV